MTQKLKQALMLGSLIVTGGVMLRLMYGSFGKVGAAGFDRKTCSTNNKTQGQGDDAHARKRYIDKIGVAARAAYLIAGEEFCADRVVISKLGDLEDDEIATLLAAGISSVIHPHSSTILFEEISLVFDIRNCEYRKHGSGTATLHDLKILSASIQERFETQGDNRGIALTETYFKRLQLLMKDAKQTK